MSTTKHQDDLVILSSVEMRRRIGSKEISPVELLEACIARIEAINPAVNAVTATCFDRARARGQGGREGGAQAASRSGRCTACRPASRTSRRPRACSPPTARRCSTTSCPSATTPWWRACAQAGAIILAKTNTPEFGAGANTPQSGLGRHRQSVRSHAECRRLVGRLGGGARDRHAAGLHRLRHRRLAAHPGRRSTAWSASARRRAWCRTSAAPWAGRRSRCSDPWGARSPTPASCWPPRPAPPFDPLACPARAAAFPRPGAIDLGSAAGRLERGFRPCPVEKGIAKVFAERIESMRHLFQTLRRGELDFGEADRCFDVIRAVSFVAGYQADYEKDKPSCSAPTSAPTTRWAPR